MTTDLEQTTEKTPAQQLVATVRTPAFHEQIALALPEGTPPARFVRVAVTALLENPDVASADPDSVYNSLLKSAADGLLPDGREAALVLFKPKSGRPKAAYLPMVGGFRKIAAEHGWTLEARVVWAEDTFAYTLGEEPHVHHSPAPLGTARTKIVAAYAVARQLETGHSMLEVLEAAEVEKIRSKAKSRAIWDEWPERMYAKTAARRLFKSLPLADRDRDRVQRVLDADELTPTQAEELVYPKASPQAPQPAGEEAAPAEAASPASSTASRGAAPAGDQEQGTEAASEPAPPAAFTGEEPPAPSDRSRPAAFVLGEEFTRHAGKTIAEVVHEDRGYVEWLASDAIADEELREVAAEALS